jgi:hypothetical protein
MCYDKWNKTKNKEKKKKNWKERKSIKREEKI